MRILIVRQDALGDLLLTTPVYRALKTAHPEARLTVMSAPQYREVLAGNPNVDELSPTSRHPGVWGALRMASTLRRKRFDAALLLKTRSGDHTLLARLAGIPVRVGSTERIYGRLLTHNLIGDLPETMHEVRRNLAHAQAAVSAPLAEFPLELEPGQGATSEAKRLVGDGPLVGIVPTTGGSEPAWPSARYAEVASSLVDRYGVRCVVTGAPGEEAVAEEVCARAGRGVFSLAGRLGLRELAAVLGRCRATVSGSTGAMHAAVAQGVPSVMLCTMADYPVRSVRWGPWKVDSETVLPPGPAMDPRQAVSTAAVLGAFERLWERLPKA